MTQIFPKEIDCPGCGHVAATSVEPDERRPAGVRFVMYIARVGGKMRRFTIPLVVAAVFALSFAAVGQSGAQSGGLSPDQLNSHGWTCFNVPGLGVHCSPPGKPWPPTQPNAQLLYFFNTTDPTSDVPDFTGMESLRRDDRFHGQPCPTEPSGEWAFLGAFAPGGPEYWGCHRR